MEEKFNELFLEPSKYYEHGLKEEHSQVVNDYFNELVKKSGIDAEGNKQTAKDLRAKKEELENVSKKLVKTKALRTFLLVIGIIFAVALIGIIFLVLRSKKKNVQQQLEAEQAKKQKEYDELLEKSRAEIAPLLALFTDSMSTELINKSAPFLKFEPRLESGFVTRMQEQFEYEVDPDVRNSSLVIQAGTMRNNPFLVRQFLHQRMEPHVYTGTLVITYTTTVSDGNGGTRIVTHTQTLIAHYTEDEPKYSPCTELVYCNDACPKLSFKRSPTDLYKMNEKQVQKYIDKFEKADNKKAAKAIKKGEGYTKMANSKFEAYWNSQGRNDEIGYRLMFTPLAQTNIVHLFSLKEPYGDDIYYSKNGMVSTLVSRHSQDMDYSGGTYNYTADTFEEVEANFINYNLGFFQGLMFDFFPLISIPIFHQNVSAPFLGSEKPDSAVPLYEVEVMANKLDPEMFKHEDSSTEVVIEAKLKKGGKDYDDVELIGHTFIAVPEVAIVPTLGGDGELHPVPVSYFIYEPLEKTLKARAYKNANTIGSNSDTLIKNKDFALEIFTNKEEK